MGNILQKIIYNLSLFTPFFITFGISYYISTRSLFLFAVFEGIAVALFLMLWIQISFTVRHVNTVRIKVKSIKIERSITIFQVLAYIAPISNGLLKIDTIYLIIAAGALLLFSIFTSPTSPNLLLRILGYKFYKIDLEDGIGDNLLITRSKLKSSNKIVYIHHLFDHTFLY